VLANALRFVHLGVTTTYTHAGLVGGEGFAVNTSVVKDDASRQRYGDDDDEYLGSE
jgi:hypothetical protein